MLSPTLFLIMFNDLLNELNYRGLLTYAYADDLAIVGKNKRSLIEATKIVEAVSYTHLTLPTSDLV